VAVIRPKSTAAGTAAALKDDAVADDVEREVVAASGVERDRAGDAPAGGRRERDVDLGRGAGRERAGRLPPTSAAAKRGSLGVIAASSVARFAGVCGRSPAGSPDAPTGTSAAPVKRERRGLDDEPRPRGPSQYASRLLRLTPSPKMSKSRNPPASPTEGGVHDRVQLYDWPRLQAGDRAGSCRRAGIAGELMAGPWKPRHERPPLCTVSVRGDGLADRRGPEVARGVEHERAVPALGVERDLRRCLGPDSCSRFESGVESRRRGCGRNVNLDRQGRAGREGCNPPVDWPHMLPR
jgi:hypothetical protein